MSDEIDLELNSLVDQLKDVASVNNHVGKNREELCEKLNTEPEEIEAFVVQNSGKLVQRSLQAIDEVKDFIMASGDPDSISALSELIRASSGALESLNKIVVQNKRSKTSMDVKTLDVTAKYAIEEKKSENALIASREEMFKRILGDAKVIETETTEEYLTQDPPHQQT